MRRPDQDIPATALRKTHWVEHDGTVQRIVQIVPDKQGDVFLRTTASGQYWLRLARRQTVGVWHSDPR